MNLRRIIPFGQTQRRMTRSKLLEEIIECAAGVGGIARWRVAVGASGISGLPLDRGSRGKETARIAQVLFHDPFRNLLRTFKPLGGIEMTAVFATVEVGLALRALAVVVNFDRRRHDRAA